MSGEKEAQVEQPVSICPPIYHGGPKMFLLHRLYQMDAEEQRLLHEHVMVLRAKGVVPVTLWHLLSVEDFSRMDPAALFRKVLTEVMTCDGLLMIYDGMNGEEALSMARVAELAFVPVEDVAKYMKPTTEQDEAEGTKSAA